MKKWITLVVLLFCLNVYAAPFTWNAKDGIAAVADNDEFLAWDTSESGLFNMTPLQIKNYVFASASTIGQNVLNSTNPGAVTFGRANADNTFTWLSASDFRTAIGLAISTNVQAYDADLTTYAGITPSANIQTLLGSANFGAARTNLGIDTAANLETSLSLGAYASDILGSATKYALQIVALPTDPGADRFLMWDDSATGAEVIWGSPAGSGDVTASSAFGADNNIIVSDGTGKGVKASGVTIDPTTKAITIPKTSGTAGDMSLYEANSTDTHGAGFRGPASITGDGAYRGLFPNARASSANMVLAWTNAGESGSGTASGPYVQTMSFVDLDDYALLTNTKLNRYHQTAHVDPNEVYSGHSGIIVMDPKTAGAITLTEIAVYLDEDPTTELTLTCYHKTAAIGYTGGTTIDANDTATGTFTATTFDDATIPSGSKIWCVIGDDPDATNTDMEISLTGTYD